MKEAIQIEIDLQKSQKNSKSIQEEFIKRLKYAKDIISTSLKKKDRNSESPMKQSANTKSAPSLKRLDSKELQKVKLVEDYRKNPSSPMNNADKKQSNQSPLQRPIGENKRLNLASSSNKPPISSGPAISSPKNQALTNKSPLKYAGANILTSSKSAQKLELPGKQVNGN